MLAILQLSDIHFAHSEGATFDLDREIQDGLLRFLPELRERVGDVGLIVVSGDIAYSGVADQYERAKAFLRDVRSRLDNPSIPVRVIPGNHDIHRATTDNASQRVWRGVPRQESMDADERAAELVRLLTGEKSGPGLVAPLQAYNDFAATFECAISHSRPHWEHTFELADGWTLRVRGLTSVLVSDEHDETDRLVLGAMQLSGLERRPGEANLTLCHHPYCWLLDGEELRPKLRNRSHVHVTGHVHQHAFDEGDPTHLHLRAGAMQPPRREKVASRFNVLTLQVLGESDPELEVTLVPLVWDSQRDSFTIDEENCRTCSLALLALPPDAPAVRLKDTVAMSRLTERLATLQFADRLHSARKISMAAEEVMRLPDHEQVGAIIKHAVTTGQLVGLWEQVELRHGRQGDEANPFEEVPEEVSS